MTNIWMAGNTRKIVEGFAELGRKLRKEFRFAQSAAFSIEAIEALYDVFWYRRYADDICESHGEVEDVWI